MGFYVRCDDNCLHEAMTKEETLNALAQLARGVFVDEDTDYEYELYVANGRLMMRRFEGEVEDFVFDETIISKVKERNAGGFITFWVGTQAQYNALTNKDPNCYYHITDSTRDADIDEALQSANHYAEEACQIAAEARNNSQNAVSTANEAVRIAFEAFGAQRVCETGKISLDSVSFEMPKECKFFSVVIELEEGIYQSTFVDAFAATYGMGTYPIGNTEYCFTVGINGNTATFAAEANYRFVNICGYY